MTGFPSHLRKPFAVENIIYKIMKVIHRNVVVKLHRKFVEKNLMLTFELRCSCIQCFTRVKFLIRFSNTMSARYAKINPKESKHTKVHDLWIGFSELKTIQKQQNTFQMQVILCFLNQLSK